MVTTTRALFVGGPLDGQIQPHHRPPAGGTVEAVQPRELTGVPLNGDETETIAADEIVRYHGHRLVDLDGTTIIVYATPDETVPTDEWWTKRGRPETRPDVTIWELAVEAFGHRRTIERLEGELAAAEERARQAFTRADELAATLEAERRDRQTPYGDA